MAIYTMYLKDVQNKTFEGNTIRHFLQTELEAFPGAFPDVDGEPEYTFFDLFLRRNYIKEIGFETVEGWCQVFKGVVDRARILYGDKVRLQMENINQLLSRVIEEEDEHTSTSYYNPTNAAALNSVDNMRVNSASRIQYKNQRIAGLFKSNPEVMEEMAKMTVLLDELLVYFDRCFVGVY